jgi:cytidyltransferase-like protein
MAGINHLKEVYEKKGKDFLDSLLNHYVIINEKVDGTFFGLKKTKDDQFKYFKKSGEISYVDRVLMKYYNSAISYFESLALEKRQRIPANFFFGFEYFTQGDAVNRKELPKNGLILSYIHKLDDNGNILATVQTQDQLNKWADYLGVERPPIIFEGNLDDDQKSEILDFVYADNDALFNKFKTTSFTKYILKALGVDDEKYDSLNLDTIIFRFYNENDENPGSSAFLAKMVDPLFQKSKTEKSTTKENKTQDYIWLIVIDLMNHFEVYDLADLKKMTDSGNTYDEKYVSLVNAMFKDFIKEYATKYEGLTLELPEYLKRPEFELDYNLVKDPEVMKLIKSNSTYAEIYKTLLNFFRKTRKKSNAGFFTNELLTQLNLIVTKIRNIIMGDEVYESLFPSFNEFVGERSEEIMLSEKDVAEGKHKTEKPVPVNILIGNFQPVTMGHIKAAMKLREKNNHKVVFVAIKNKQTAKSPFSLKETRIMLEKVQQEYKEIIADVKIISSGQLEEIMDVLLPQYEPLLWGTSEARLKEYALQLDYIKKKKIPLRLASDFKLVQLPSFTKSEEVVKLIKDSNYLEFKKIVPISIASEFFNLQKELETKLNESFTSNDVELRLKENDDKSNENIL